MFERKSYGVKLAQALAEQLRDASESAAAGTGSDRDQSLSAAGRGLAIQYAKSRIAPPAATARLL
jgi:hypothetical protein